jgi:cytochrome c nitrite reductase small subunit
VTKSTIAGIVLGGAAGLAAGLGGYTFLYAKGGSYLTNDPAACANCHVMREQFDGWLKSSHRAVAVCNDCHTPHALLPKYATKASNGYHHSHAFTTGEFHEPIQITARNLEITENACRHCHADLVLAIEGPHASARRMSCVRCHPSVGHME